jgi:hypothetical protein
MSDELLNYTTPAANDEEADDEPPDSSESEDEDVNRDEGQPARGGSRHYALRSASRKKVCVYISILKIIYVGLLEYGDVIEDQD